MLRLKPGQWLSDDTINFYFELLVDRSKDNENLPKIAFYNSFFYEMLSESYSRVEKFKFKKLVLFDLDILLVPLHLGVHGALGAVDLRKQRIAYYDSMCTRESTPFFGRMKSFLDKRYKKRYPGKSLDIDAWEVKMMNVPQQENGNDCGMFMCGFAECVASDRRVDFSQEDIPNMSNGEFWKYWIRKSKFRLKRKEEM